MKTEIDTLTKRINAVSEVIGYMVEEGEDTTSAEVVLATLKDRLATLTAPKIKDDVLGRGIRQGIGNMSRILSFRDFKITFDDPAYTFHPLTIEELLPTLAQWVPGAVSWCYVGPNRINLFTKDGNAGFSLPAPPRGDWESVSGEL